jgi:guanine deaminase
MNGDSVKLMNEAILEALAGVRDGHGGPFGAIVVREGTIVGRGHNRVVAHNDPTAHAEIVAIREACASLGTFNLSDCDLYTTCEPCPMCYAAAWWSRLRTIYFGCDRHDAESAGFDDAAIYEDLEQGIRKVQMIQIGREACLGPIREWGSKPDRVSY